MEIGRRERIRTSDPFVPNEVRYQAALHADEVVLETALDREVGQCDEGILVG